MGKCKYISENYPYYQCDEDSLGDSKEGYCIFHERRKDKDIDKFKAGIKDKMEKGDYDFKEYYFPEHIDFSKYNKGQFEDQVTFGHAEFHGGVRFIDAAFQGWAIFVGTKFLGEARFEGAKFHGRANFSLAKFQGGTLFDEAEFQGWALFDRTEFCGTVSFLDAEFQRMADFDGAEFHRGLALMTTEFRHTVCFRGTSFAFQHRAEEAYRKAKISYQREGDYAEAGYYHLKEMRSRRRAKERLENLKIRKPLDFLMKKSAQISIKLVQAFLELARRHPHLSKSSIVAKIQKYTPNIEKPNERFGKKLESALVLLSRGLERFFMDWTCGYGEKPLWVIRTAAIVILGIAILYWLSGGIVLRPGADITIREPGFLDSVYFSVVTFTTLGYGDWHPDPNHWIRYVAMAEAFTGAFMMALFVLCFARKWMR